MVSESEIIKGCIKGDWYYEELLYNRYSLKMFGVCLRYIKKRSEAEDCLQEGFIEVFRKIKLYKGKGLLEGWIRKIMINTAIDSINANQIYNSYTDLEDIKDFVPIFNIENENLSANYLLKMIQNLPEEFRIVFNLYAIDGYSHKEIAEMLNITETNSRTKLLRARKLLKKKLAINEIIKIPSKN